MMFGMNNPWCPSFYYTIVAPKNVRLNSDFVLNLTIHDEKCEINEPAVVGVSIEDSYILFVKDETKFPQVVTLKPNVTEVVSIPVGDIPIDRNYKLVVKSISGIAIERHANLCLQTQKHAILIQTNKPIYKPNDSIKFRVLVLDSELRAAEINDNELSIEITVSFLLFFESFISFHLWAELNESNSKFEKNLSDE